MLSILREQESRPLVKMPGTLRNQTWVKLRSICLTIIVAAVFAIPAKGDMVYGRVFGTEGKFQPGDSFTVKDSTGRTIKEVKTDERKGFSVFLSPGSYKVEFKDKDKATWEGQIESYPQPARQDIHLKKR